MAVATTTALMAGALATGGAAAMDYKANKDSIKSMEKQKAQSQAYIDKAISDARQDIFKLYPAAQESRKQGLDAGLSLYGQAYPGMMNTFQQGNTAAQQQLLAGLPQMNNAILGRPVDTSGLQAIALQQPQMPQVQAPQFAQIQNLGLAGLAGPGGG